MPHTSFSIRRVALSTALGLLLSCGAHATSPSASAENNLSLRQRVESSNGDFPLVAKGIALKSETSLQAFYLSRDFALAWHDEQGKPTRQAQAAVEAIGAVLHDGLIPEDYHHNALLQYYHDGRLPADQPDPAAAAVEYDLLLSDAMANLSQHLLAGKVDPETLSPEWKAQRRTRNLAVVLQDVVSAEDVGARINALRPNQVRYFRLQKLLQQLREKPAPDWQPLATAPLIRPLSQDSRLPAIRQRLAYWGDLPANAPTDSETNPAIHEEPDSTHYDETTVAALKNFQRRHGLDEDGVVGRLTLEALNYSPAEREKQVVNNLERWRWLAEDLGAKHVLVNIAGFELKVIENNQTVMRKPVIVGRDYRRTPVFSDRIRYLVLNPTWTVPTSLAVKDKLPEIRKDPDYLNRLGFTVYDRNQNRVDPATVDWQSVSGRGFPYRLVQAPGSQNALGQVKFMFPNPHDVYLHDTPARELFSKTGRAFSSGCVRVSDPLELAEWLLRDNGMSRAQIDAVIASGELQTIFLKRPVPVHIEYWTAWIDSSGELHFREDIYRRDPSLAAALAIPLY